MVTTENYTLPANGEWVLVATGTNEIETPWVSVQLRSQGAILLYCGPAGPAPGGVVGQVLTGEIAPALKIWKAKYLGPADHVYARSTSDMNETVCVVAVTEDVPAVPTLAVTDVIGETVTITLDQILDETQVPATTDFAISEDGGAGPGVDAVTIEGNVVTLTLDASVAPVVPVLLSYTPGSPALTGLNELEVEAISGFEVTNNAEAAPALDDAATDETGLLVILTFDAPLDESSVPATTDFAVTEDAGAIAVDAVDVTGAAVTLTLDSAISNGGEVEVSYTPGAERLLGVNTVPVAAIVEEPVTNNVPE